MLIYINTTFSWINHIRVISSQCRFTDYNNLTKSSLPNSKFFFCGSLRENTNLNFFHKFSALNDKLLCYTRENEKSVNLKSKYLKFLCQYHDNQKKTCKKSKLELSNQPSINLIKKDYMESSVQTFSYVILNKTLLIPKSIRNFCNVQNTKKKERNKKKTFELMNLQNNSCTNEYLGLSENTFLNQTYSYILLFSRVVHIALICGFVGSVYSVYKLLYTLRLATNINTQFLEDKVVNFIWDFLEWYIFDKSPCFVKCFQWAGTRYDLFSEDFCRRCSRFFSSTKPSPFIYIKQILNNTYGPEWEKILYVHPKPIGKGSIAQVYQGIRYDTETNKYAHVAIKILHPYIHTTTATDIRILNGLVSLSQYLPQSRWISVGDIFCLVIAAMKSQLNLLEEARHIEVFNRNFQNNKRSAFFRLNCDFSFPQIHWDLCRQNILVESFEHGHLMSEVYEFLTRHKNVKSGEKQEDLVIYTRRLIPCINYGLKCLKKIVSQYYQKTYLPIIQSKLNQSISDASNRFLLSNYVSTYVTEKLTDAYTHFASKTYDSRLKKYWNKPNDKVLKDLTHIRYKLAKAKFLFYLRTVFEDNFYTMDLHPGNIIVQFKKPFSFLDYRKPESRNDIVWYSASQLSDLVEIMKESGERKRNMFLSDKFKLTIIDCGLTSSTSPVNYTNFNDSIRMLLNANGYSLGKLIYERAADAEAENPQKFCEEMETLIENLYYGTGSINERLKTAATNFLILATRHKVKLESEFMKVFIGFFVIQGCEVGEEFGTRYLSPLFYLIKKYTRASKQFEVLAPEKYKLKINP